jgi:hypothetical protein
VISCFTVAFASTTVTNSITVFCASPAISTILSALVSMFWDEKYADAGAANAMMVTMVIKIAILVVFMFSSLSMTLLNLKLRDTDMCVPIFETLFPIKIGYQIILCFYLTIRLLLDDYARKLDSCLKKLLDMEHGTTKLLLNL